jgi:hypothetical protein
MAWDPARPVPWKRLFTFVIIYSLIVLGVFSLLRPTQIVQSIPGVVFGAVVAVGIMAVLTKFGWNPTMLKSRAEIAEARAERAAAKARPATPSRAASSTTPTEGPRPKPAPTKRTSTGPTNNPRRTRGTRKR